MHSIMLQSMPIKPHSSLRPALQKKPHTSHQVCLLLLISLCFISNHPAATNKLQTQDRRKKESDTRTGKYKTKSISLLSLLSCKDGQYHLSFHVRVSLPLLPSRCGKLSERQRVCIRGKWHQCVQRPAWIAAGPRAIKTHHHRTVSAAVLRGGNGEGGDESIVRR